MFWIVGLTSPLVVVRARLLGAHQIGAGLMLWALTILLRAVREDERHVAPFGVGLTFGVSASMRTETFVVAFVSVGLACMWLAVSRKRVWAAVTTGVLAVAGFAVPWFANAGLESWLGGNPRSGRVGGTVSGAVDSPAVRDAGTRLHEALITWFGVPNLHYPARVVLGVLAVVLLLAAYPFLRRRDVEHGRFAVVASVCVVAVSMVVGGPGFVPGALIAAPIAVLAFWGWPASTARRFLVAVSLGSTILIWRFGYVGGAEPQWGSRYLLVPTLLLLILGTVRLARSDRDIRRLLVAFSTR